MAIDRAAFISEMDVSVPDKRDPRSEGADQIQTVKRAVQSSFPNVDDVVNATAARMNEIFDNPNQRFLQEVTMYSGDVQSIPEGWMLCDGNSGTTINGITIPDLSDRFVKAYNNATEPVGATGGDHNGVAEHRHNMTHTHTRGSMEITGSFNGDDRLRYPTGAFTTKYNSENGGAEGTDGSSMDMNFQASRSWSGSTSEPSNTYTQYEGTSGGNQPAYYVLAFLIYVGNVEE